MKEDVIDLEIPLSSDEDEEMGELVQTGDDDGILPPNSMQFDVESDEMSAQDTLEDKPLAERDKYMELTKKILDDLESSGIENRLNFNQYRRAPPQEKRESSKNNSRSFGMNRRPDGQVSDIARGAFRLRRNFNVNFSPSKESAQQRTKSNKSADGSSKQATGPTTQILLVRHGQSTWNAEGRWQGQADMSLSSLGVAQSVQAALRLSGGPQVLAEGGGIPDIGAIYSSNMKRAKQTAQILSSQAGLGKIMEDERFRERSVGEWSGLTYEEVQQKWPGYLKRRLLPPSYETDDMVLPRVFSALDYVRMQHPGQRVVVVCHAGVIYAVEAYLKAKSGYRNPQRRYRIGNLGSRWVIWDGSGFRLGRRVNLIADGGVSSALPELYQE
uniref:Phosphoglycerate mutase n=1 Tax=Guillardia theta TaxID=55529 RepID=A0A7S4P0K4_GUITH